MRLPIRNVPSRNHGFAVVVMIVLLSLMMIYVMANLKTLHFMSRELKLIEKRQVQRLSATAPVTPTNTQTRTNGTPSAASDPEPAQAPEK